MTPKKQAQELFDKMMYHIMHNCQPTLSEMVARECALVAVDDILNIRMINRIVNRHQLGSEYDYWLQVKQEIELL